MAQRKDATVIPLSAEMTARAAAGGQMDPSQRRSRVGAFFDRIRSAWFGPGVSNAPLAPEGTPPRQWDYPVGINYRITPRGEELVSFPQLRAVADQCTGVRLCIETRKDQMEKFTWSIRPLNPDNDPEKDPRVQQLTAFLKYPDRVNPWKQWLRMLLEEVLVTDATSIYIHPNRGGKPYALEQLDGASIRPLMDETGRRPLDGPAYQQIIKGVPSGEFMVNELIYAPRNPRVSRVYGYSPTEQLVFLINMAIRRDVHKLQWYTDGTVPDALVGVPNEWNIDQTARFQAYWDSVMESDTAVRRKARFIPGDIARNYIPTKEAVLKDEMDEWLMRMICYAFSLPPTPFVKQMNRAIGETVQNTALEEGLLPIMEWVKALLDRIIQEIFGYDDLGFYWQEVREPDPLVKAQTDKIYVELGVKSIDQVAEDLGLDAPGMGPAVFLASGVTLVSDLVRMSNAAADQAENPPPPPPQLPPPGGLEGPKGEQPPGKPAEKPVAEPGEERTAAVGKVTPFRRVAGPRALLESSEAEPQRIGFIQTLKADGPPAEPTRDVREIGGLTIVIENPSGSVRHWGDEPEDTTAMGMPYGYVVGTEGMDGDSLDVFLGPMWAEATELPVLVVTITKPPAFTELDEEKVLIGWPDADSARRAFLEHYDQDERFIGREEVLTWSGLLARLQGEEPVAKRATRRFIAQLSSAQRARLAGAARDHPAVLRYQKQLERRILPVLRHVAVQVAAQLSTRLGKATGDQTVASAIADLNLDGFILLAEPTKKILKAVASEGAKRSVTKLGVQDDFEAVFAKANARAIAFAEERSAAMVGMRWEGDQLVPAVRAEYQITEGTRALLRETIAAAFREEQTKGALRDAIVADYAFSPERAALIARTEISRAEIAGNLAGWQASEVVVGKEWILGSEHDIDDSCDDAADDGEIGLDEEFSNGETEPPGHPACICDLLPSIEGEEEGA